ncbi:MAG TPA: FliA/WhiG family RNA polymerase sigma factor [Lachnospiraceae bacterium]|jgi:RNA polymerase sigma factor for flagellar operon FliA|nr:FliA/WhiG family RNA polymerase sigma factor [Lachnospiraceae bacterium]HBY72426.1 FliA/WhiG family RNA polymerase sigma factor [Lachnospiraceae bacterium]HCA69227.1 FliA/WhiG family RNA polymerase sigma factor [Lachnospiraceae bacterium]HCM12950.1 FliA/WhiG family RNA polymerase sigma factor [Lachnospiraceae bacterium]HCR39578.1 FliA/WhiG family RNA polymerase sigma factor [Lachnospiraceae bacterium]
MNAEDREKLWEEYSIKKTSGLQEKLIIEYTGLVKIVAGRLSMYLGYNVEYDDLVGYGVFGLIDAIDKFDYSKGVKFETYASLRIRGAILDQIRKMDWIPRSIRQKQRKLDQAYQSFETRNQRAANDEEIAEELEIPLEELELWQNQTKVTNIISLDEFMEQGSEGSIEKSFALSYEPPERIIEKQELKNLLVKTLETLTEKEKTVIILYYYEELTLKEISLILEVSESRVSQLHTKALQKMKIKLGKNIDIFLN